MDIVKSGSTWMICTAPILDANGARLTGLTDIAFSVRRYTSGAWQWLDFADSTFKASPGTLRAVMSAVDATKAAGVYGYALDTSAITNVAFGDQLFIDIQQTSLTNASNANQAGGGVYGEVVDKIETNLNTKIAHVTGTASAGAATSITLAGLSAVDDFYRFSYVEITGGTGAGQTRVIVAYVGSTKVATVNRPWVTTPDSTSTFAIRASAQPVILDAGLAQAGGASTITLRATSSATDSLYVGATVVILGGTGMGQERVVTAYVGSTKVATLATAWTTQPDSTSVYALLPVGRSITVSNLDKTGYSVSAIGTDVIDAASLKADAVTELADAVRAGIIYDHGSGDYTAPANVTLADGSLTAAKVGSGFVDLVQLGLATRAAELFDVEIVTTPSGESIYFPYFKGGSPVLGATLSMSVSRIGIVIVEGVPTEAFETLDFNAEIFVAPADNTGPVISMEPLDAAYPGIYTQHFSQEFPGNAVSPDIYTVWIYDGAQLVGMGRLRIGMADTISALPADITSARDHVETAVAGGFTEIKGAGWTAGQDDLKAIRARGDTAWVTANLSGIATSANVTDAVTATLAGIVSAHGAGSYLTASVAGLATGGDVAAAVAAIEAYGQAHRQTATTVGLNDGALLPAKIGAGFVNAMQANLALEASLTAMKGASFDGATDSLRALRVLVSAIPTAGAPSAATIRDAVWADSNDAPTAGSRGWELWRLAQWGTETNPKKIVGNELRLYTPGLGSVLAAVTLHDAAGNDIAPGTGEPAQYLP